MKISSDIYAFIDDDNLVRLIDSNNGLKDYVSSEMDHMTDIGVGKGCPANSCAGCAGCARACSLGAPPNAAYLSTALISIFNYYIPDEIKNAIHLGGGTSVGE